MTRRAISAARYRERIEQAQVLLPQHDAAALLIGVGADLQWLTGYAAMPLERLTMLIVPQAGTPSLIVPRLERAAAESAPAVAGGLLDVVTWQETDDPFALVADRLAASGSRPAIQLGPLGGAWGRLGTLLISDGLRAAFLLKLQAAMPDAAFGLASVLIAPLRAVKDAAEVALLRDAAHAADRVVAAIAGSRLLGRSEAEVAREVRDRLVDEGHELAAFAIVASGPNSASPHHDPGARLIGPGEPIVLDIGGRLGGYHSDITRTLWVTGAEGVRPSDEFARLFDTLHRAQAAGRAAVKPGTSAEAVDDAARRVIADAGLAEHFIHRTGHGIGLEVHEEPYIVTGNAEPLIEGHAFSVEPGIYIDGQHGARIEDIVVCGADGADELNQADRGLYVVRG